MATFKERLVRLSKRWTALTAKQESDSREEESKSLKTDSKAKEGAAEPEEKKPGFFERWRTRREAATKAVNEAVTDNGPKPGLFTRFLCFLGLKDRAVKNHIMDVEDAKADGVQKVEIAAAIKGREAEADAARNAAQAAKQTKRDKKKQSEALKRQETEAAAQLRAEVAANKGNQKPAAQLGGDHPKDNNVMELVEGAALKTGIKENLKDIFGDKAKVSEHTFRNGFTVILPDKKGNIDFDFGNNKVSFPDGVDLAGVMDGVKAAGKSGIDVSTLKPERQAAAMVAATNAGLQYKGGSVSDADLKKACGDNDDLFQQVKAAKMEAGNRQGAQQPTQPRIASASAPASAQPVASPQLQASSLPSPK